MTDETKYTPGKWRCNAATGYILGDDVLIAIVGDYRDRELLPFNKHRWDADAQLIAAAPDLLEALKDARFYLYGRGPGNQKIDDAIAKAEGSSK